MDSNAFRRIDRWIRRVVLTIVPLHDDRSLGVDERVTFGLLRRPENAPQFPPEKLKEIQKGHMANIEAMAASGDLVIAGPFGDDGTLRGVFVFRGTDEAHLREIAAPDTAIQTGRLVLDLYRWVVPAGTLPPR